MCDVKLLCICSQLSVSVYPQYTTVYHSIPQYTAVYHSIPQFFCVTLVCVKILTLSHSPCTQSWLVTETTVYGMKLSTPFQLIGQVSLEDYEKWIKWFQEEQTASTRSDPLTCRSYAR